MRLTSSAVPQSSILAEIVGDNRLTDPAVLIRAAGGTDDLTAIAAVHALSAADPEISGPVLAGLLSSPRAVLREHASWALMSLPAREDALDDLVAAVVAGGFGGMLAQRTLAGWGTGADALITAWHDAPDAEVRARIVETLGITAGAVAARAVDAVASDADEDPRVRIAAVAALGDRTGDPTALEIISGLISEDGELGAVARLAAADLAGDAAPVRDQGLTVAQLFLHADLDPQLSRAGAGDTGGIATLLVRLGGALVAERGIGRVLTMSRGTAESALTALRPFEGHQLAAVPLLRPAGSAAEAWPAWAAARRGIRRLLRAHSVDLLHLRMADVGSLAAAEAASELGIPIVFTLAPDPHGAIEFLPREDFGAADQREHLFFRARLVRRLTADAAHVALFPRARLHDDLLRLTGTDIAADPDRFTVVPEGIDLTVTEAAAGATVALDLPPARRGLPLALSVGRLHRVKGMATLVEVWASDPGLWQRCNLVILGGDLANPSADERGQLDLIADVLRRHPEAANGLVMPGHQQHDVVARWLASAGPGSVYVCASLKEEFGLALLEALAAGLVVVGPDAGGPPAYVDQGRTGLLTDTTRPAELARAFRGALDLAAGEGQAARAAFARERVRAGFTVQAMAATLGKIYTTVTKEVDRP
ncbi:glycosyltransferase [Actinoplanes friuliensis]|uniref:Group 1 glycosyl transferase n=1 Tax=Actinoplanes friuliensis DSM 7358 TaxID=1246995 RepID=U5W457_9ACTN|nr:glycosyltransferase [Actinoplanes friuliensis]AGZ42765.1 group 1 glycosyl transferase [Actinoplanes friuliensis DSM 7358]